MRKMSPLYLSLVLVVVATVAASGQSFQVQCPPSTITHPAVAITGASESISTVTITSSLAPTVGDFVTITGVSPAGYNGTFAVISVGSGTFSYTDPIAGLGV